MASTRRVCSLALTLLVALPALAAWSYASGTPVTEPAPGSAEQILQSASQRLAATPTIRFALDIQGTTYIDDADTIQLLSARGELVRPDRVRTDFKIKIFGGITISTSLIIVGEQHWSTDLITGKWGPAPEEFGYDPSILFDNQNGIGPVMNRVTSAVRLPDDSVRDHDCYHVQATVDQAIIDPLTAGSLQGNPITVDLWIDRGNYDLIRAQLSEPGGTPDTTPVVWTLDLSGHGSDIKIDPPA